MKQDIPLRPARREQSVMRGAVVLLAATGLVKLIGAFFKIPLTNLLGGEGMGYFSTAYGLFNPIYALLAAGFPTALAKLVSQYRAQGRIADLQRTCRLATGLFCLTGLAGAGAIWLLAEPFCRVTGNPQALWSVRMIAPALLFGCVMSVWRGYYQGMGTMTPTAWSQLAEALTKLVCGVGAVLLVRRQGLALYARTGCVFGLPAASSAQAEALLLPFCSAGAVAGVSLSTLAGTLFLGLYHLCTGGRARYRLRPPQPPRSRRSLTAALCRTALPVCLGAVAANLTGVVDLFTLMNGLERAVSQNPELVLSTLPTAVSDTVPLAALPNFLYGSYQGLAGSLYTLLPAVTASLGVSALPAVSAAFAKGDLRLVRHHAGQTLQMTLLLSLPAGLGLAALSGPVLAFLYPDRPVEAAVAAPLLCHLGFTGILAALSVPLNSLLQAVGRADLPVKFLLLGAGTKLLLNLLLLPDPRFHIWGAPWGSTLCYLLLTALSLVSLCRITGLRPDFGCWGKLLLGAVLCALAAWACRYCLPAHLPQWLRTLFPVGAGGAVYGGILIIFRLFPHSADKSFCAKGKNTKTP